MKGEIHPVSLDYLRRLVSLPGRVECNSIPVLVERRLVDHGLVEHYTREGCTMVRATEAGRRQLDRLLQEKIEKPAKEIMDRVGHPMSEARRYPFVFVHPELKQPWRYTSHTQEDAAKAFEDIWALRVQEGLLEHVDGGFFDGEVRVGEVGQEDNLCPSDLSGHMWVDDTRAERLQFARCPPGYKPTVCVLCKTVGWSRA